MLLGVHCSVAGGMINAFNEVHNLKIDTFQVFTKNQRQWKEKEITIKEGKPFITQLKEDNIKYAFSHCTYLINLASIDENLRQNSILALAGELVRCHSLGLSYCVLHPGASKGGDEKDGIKRIGDALNLVIKATPDLRVQILLENTAGQGTSIGHKFEQLNEIIKQVNSPDRIGVCFDTCHAFAAGYDIRTRTGFEEAMANLDRNVGLDKLKVFHLNDSKGNLASKIDRHENIGKGKIGLAPFKEIMNVFAHVPKVIETPKEFDKENLEVLRGLV